MRRLDGRAAWVVVITGLAAAVVVLVGCDRPERRPALAPALSTELQRPGESDFRYQNRVEELADYRQQLANLADAGVPLTEEREQELLDLVAACQQRYVRNEFRQNAIGVTQHEERKAATRAFLADMGAFSTAAKQLLTAEQRRVADLSWMWCVGLIVDDERLRRSPDLGQGWPESASERRVRVETSVRRIRMVTEAAYATAIDVAELDPEEDMAIRRALVELGELEAVDPEQPTVAEAVRDPRVLFGSRAHAALLEVLGAEDHRRFRAELRHLDAFVDVALLDHAEQQGLGLP